MYKLEIETKNATKEIQSPTKAVSMYLIFVCFVLVMDEKSQWHSIGHCFHKSDALWAVSYINEAIGNHESSVYVDIS